MEAAVLGALLIDPRVWEKVGWLEPEHFYDNKNRWVFIAIRKLCRANKAVDVITVPEVLKVMGKLDDAGGAYYVAELSEMVSSAAGVETYVSQLHNCYLLRRAIEESTGIIEAAYRPGSSGFKVVDDAAGKLLQLGEGGSGRQGETVVDASSAAEMCLQMYQQLRELKPGETPGIPFDFGGLNDMTGGMEDEDLIVIAGRPGQGKTSFALGAARSAAKRGTPVGFFSFESVIRQIFSRMVAQETHEGTHFRQIRDYLTDEKWSKLYKGVSQLSELPIYFDEVSKRPESLVRSARRMKREYGIGLVVVDYLQIMDLQGENENMAITHASRILKGLAKELKIPIMILSQLSRWKDGAREAPRPILNDLRGSGSIEQDADKVIFIHRKWEYLDADKRKKYKKDHGEEKTEEMRRYAELLVKKTRNGPTGVDAVWYFAEYTHFVPKTAEKMPF